MQIGDAINSILLDLPHFAPLLLRLHFVACNKRSAGTMATDGRNVYYCHSWAKRLSLPELATAILHECYHCAFLHHLSQREGYEQQRANMAQDHEINLRLDAAGLAPITGWFCNKKFTGLAWQEIYRLLPETDCCSCCCCGGFLPSADIQQQTEEWAQALADHIVLAKQAGLTPGGEDIFLKQAKPKIPWQRLLANYVRQFAGQSDWTWKRLGRRSSADAIFPGRKKDRVESVVVIFDTSGSMEAGQLAAAYSELSSLVDQQIVGRITWMSADAEVQQIVDIEETFATTAKGGGGTDFRPAFAAATKFNPQLIVYFSDLDGVFPERVQTPTIWITDTDRAVPFGKVIRFHC